MQVVNRLASVGPVVRHDAIAALLETRLTGNLSGEQE